jgi:hypothetical protein
VQAAINTLKEGETLLFPCVNGGRYIVKSPIDFGALRHVTLQGTDRTCGLFYSSSRSNTYAFSLAGADSVTFENLRLFSVSNTIYPKVVLLMGRLSSNSGSAHHVFDKVQIDGYATKALVYNIASEEDAFTNIFLILNGGGAKYVYYTSNSDDLRIASLALASNLSVWFSHFHIDDYSADLDATHSLVYIHNQSSAGGDEVWRDGYFGQGEGPEEKHLASAVTIHADKGAGNSQRTTFDSNRYENGLIFFHIDAAGGSVSDLRLTNNSFATAAKTGYFLYASPGSTLSNVYLSDNETGYTQDHSLVGLTSALGRLQNSYVAENYPVTATSISNSTIQNRLTGTFTVGLLEGVSQPPSVSSCGMSPAVAPNSSTLGGTITEGTGTDGCRLKFASPPSRCVVTSEAGLTFRYSLSGNVLTVSNAGALSSTKLDWTCTR